MRLFLILALMFTLSCQKKESQTSNPTATTVAESYQVWNRTDTLMYYKSTQLTLNNLDSTTEQELISNCAIEGCVANVVVLDKYYNVLGTGMPADINTAGIFLENLDLEEYYGSVILEVTTEFNMFYVPVFLYKLPVPQLIFQKEGYPTNVSSVTPTLSCTDTYSFSVVADNSLTNYTDNSLFSSYNVSNSNAYSYTYVPKCVGPGYTQENVYVEFRTPEGIPTGIWLGFNINY